MVFQNRVEAAELLIPKLSRYRMARPLVLGIPRGAMPMAQVLADRLGGELDVVLVHKIGAPDNPEFAIGSVSEYGCIYLSESVRLYGYSMRQIDAIAHKETAKLKERRATYSPIRPAISPEGRTVIIVDDGIATGSTMLAAIRAVRGQNPKRVIVAAPVASPQALHSLKHEADETIVLEAPEDFFSISQFYEEFIPVSDTEVIEILSNAGAARKAA